MKKDSLMSQKKICLASDNWTPTHPLIIKAITEANEGYAPSYGSDAWTEEAGNLIQKAFNSKCKVFIVPTGTGYAQHYDMYHDELLLPSSCQEAKSTLFLSLAVTGGTTKLVTSLPRYFLPVPLKPPPLIS